MGTIKVQASEVESLSCPTSLSAKTRWLQSPKPDNVFTMVLGQVRYPGVALGAPSRPWCQEPQRWCHKRMCNFHPCVWCEGPRSTAPFLCSEVSMMHPKRTREKAKRGRLPSASPLRRTPGLAVVRPSFAFQNVCGKPVEILPKATEATEQPARGGEGRVAPLSDARCAQHHKGMSCVQFFPP